MITFFILFYAFMGMIHFGFFLYISTNEYKGTETIKTAILGFLVACIWPIFWGIVIASLVTVDSMKDRFQEETHG